MITINKLREFGCNVDEGLARCVNNEDLYLRLVNTLLKDNKVEELKEAIENRDLDKAFQIAHSLKGVYGNLSITPLYNKICVLVELLRNKTEIDYSSIVQEIYDLYQKFLSLAD